MLTTSTARWLTALSVVLVAPDILDLPVPRCWSASASPLDDCGDPWQCLTALTESRAKGAILRGRFRQTKHVALLREPLISTGTFLIAPPDRVRWEVTTPEALVIEVTDGRLRAGPPGKLEEVRHVPVAALAEIGGVLAGDPRALRTRFQVRRGERPGAFVLVPEDAALKRVIDKIELSLDAGTGAPRRVVLFEQGGDSSEIEFLEVQQEVREGDQAAK